LNTELRIRLLLSAQRALLGAVTPNIRAVRCGVEERLVWIEFIFDSGYSDEDWDRCEVVAAEVIADFSDERIDTRYRVLPPPARIARDEDSLEAYRRFEEI